MKKYLILIILLGLAVAVGMAFNEKELPKASLGGSVSLSVFESLYRTVKLTNGGVENATTSIDYLTTSATTTYQFGSDRGELYDINLFFVASTSESGLAFVRQYSSNGQDWYNEDCKTNSSNILVTHGPAACRHLWLPGAVATSTKNITVDPVASKFTRLLFQAVTQPGALHLQVVVRERAN